MTRALILIALGACAPAYAGDLIFFEGFEAGSGLLDAVVSAFEGLLQLSPCESGIVDY